MSILIIASCALACGALLASFRSVFTLIVLLALVTISAAAAAVVGNIDAARAFGLWLAVIAGLQVGYFIGLMLRSAALKRSQTKNSEPADPRAAVDIHPDRILDKNKSSHPAR